MIIEWLKERILGIEVDKADISDIVSKALTLMDEDGDGSISIREFIKTIRRVADDLHDRRSRYYQDPGRL